MIVKQDIFAHTHNLCTHHSDSIVEESLPKYDYMYLLIHPDVLKHIQHSYRIHSWDDGRKQQVLLQ